MIIRQTSTPVRVDSLTPGTVFLGTHGTPMIRAADAPANVPVGAAAAFDLDKNTLVTMSASLYVTPRKNAILCLEQIE